MLNYLEIIENKELLKQVGELKAEGCRFAALTCEEVAEGFELTWHFDLDYELRNIRITVKKGENVESISGIYPAAFLIENEIQDFFGIVFDNLSIDYKGRLILSENAPAYPLG